MTSNHKGKLMFKTIVGAALALGIYGLASPAQAAPAASSVIGFERAAPASPVAETTYRHRHYGHRHYKRHRHYGHRHYYGHRRFGHRHYGHRHAYRPAYRPGIYLHFGGGRRHW